MPISIYNNSLLQLPLKRISEVSVGDWIIIDDNVTKPYQIYRMLLTGGTNSTSAGARPIECRIRNTVTGATRLRIPLQGLVVSAPVYLYEIIAKNEVVELENGSATLEYFDRKLPSDEDHNA